MEFTIKTNGHYDFVDITEKVSVAVRELGLVNGAIVVFIPGSTAAVTTMEYEGGVIEDLKDVFEKLAPENAEYKHHKKWGDKNGAAHIKSALVGTSLVVPVKDGLPTLGVWQQIVLIDFDEKPRKRKIIIAGI